MNDIINVGTKDIGKDEPCFIIAEGGVNHNGSLDLAKKIVDKAAQAGVDAIKFQLFTAEEVCTKNVGMVDYQKENTGKAEAQIEMLRRLELSYDNHIILQKYAEEKGLIFMSSAASLVSFKQLDDIHVPVFKVGSSDVTNMPYLKAMARTGKPIIFSTGMSNMNEVKQGVKWMTEEGNENIVVLQCTTNYPCPYEEANVSAMDSIEKETGCLVGYSDHTLTSLAAALAVNRGAVVVEKHFTLDKNMEGPDHKASVDPEELSELVKVVRYVEKNKCDDEKLIDDINTKFNLNLEKENIAVILGNGEKTRTTSEEKLVGIVRKSIVSTKEIKSGEKITEDMLSVKRPSFGIPPKDFFNVVGKNAKQDIPEDITITKEMVDW